MHHSAVPWRWTVAPNSTRNVHPCRAFITLVREAEHSLRRSLVSSAPVVHSTALERRTPSEVCLHCSQNHRHWISFRSSYTADSFEKRLPGPVYIPAFTLIPYEKEQARGVRSHVQPPSQFLQACYSRRLHNPELTCSAFDCLPIPLTSDPGAVIPCKARHNHVSRLEPLRYRN